MELGRVKLIPIYMIALDFQATVIVLPSISNGRIVMADGDMRLTTMSIAVTTTITIASSAGRCSMAKFVCAMMIAGTMSISMIIRSATTIFQDIWMMGLLATSTLT